MFKNGLNDYVRISMDEKDGMKDYFLPKELHDALKEQLGDDYSKWKLAAYAEYVTVYKKSDFEYVFPVFSNNKRGGRGSEYSNTEMITWLATHGGKPQEDWKIEEGKLIKNRFGPNRGRFIVVCFKEAKRATHFKMVWADDIVI